MSVLRLHAISMVNSHQIPHSGIKTGDHDSAGGGRLNRRYAAAIGNATSGKYAMPLTERLLAFLRLSAGVSWVPRRASTESGAILPAAWRRWLPIH